MQITITTRTGSIYAGILMAVSGPTLRVAVRGFDDVVEFRLQGGQWFSETGELVEIKVCTSTDDAGAESPYSGMTGVGADPPRACVN